MLNYSSIALSLGEYAAPMGTGAALVLLACGLFLWSQKDAHMTASVSFLATCALIAFFFPRQAGLAESDVLVNALPRLQCVRDELLTGAVLFIYCTLYRAQLLKLWNMGLGILRGLLKK